MSVIVPTYNRVALVQRAIRNLLNQTRVPDEIIVVDDGSTDGTPEILQKFALPVKFISQENRGLAAARNTGLKLATGDLVAFLDDDDTLPFDSIQVRAEALEMHADIHIVFGEAFMVDMNETPIRRFYFGSLRSGNLLPALACHSLFPVHATMIRRQVFSKVGFFDETLGSQEDVDFWLRIATRYDYLYINKVLAYYHVHANMMTARREAMELNEINVRERVFSTIAFEYLSSADRSRIYMTHGSRHMIVNLIADARSWYIKAIKTAPLLPRPYMLFLLSLAGKRSFDWVSSFRRRFIGGIGR